MNDRLLELWNETVGPGDEVWRLGDFAIRQKSTVVAGFLGRLHGRKHLVTGNNDPPATTELDGWRSVQPYAARFGSGENGIHHRRIKKYPNLLISYA